MKNLFLIILLLICSRSSAISQTKTDTQINVFPSPLEIIIREGQFEISSNTAIFVNEDALLASELLKEKLKTGAGIILKNDPNYDQDFIRFINDTTLNLFGKESYIIDINTKGILISANEGAGYFYAVQTLLQLLPPEVLAAGPSNRLSLKLQCLYIKDMPKYPWRSFMLDSGRQFQTKEFIKKYLDYLAMLKINVFHWHLTEGQGWRIEIKKYPELTKIGSCVAAGDEQQGFYSQDVIKEIIDYAKSKFITVVPEIDLPGHSEAALIAFPEYTCSGIRPETVMEFSPNLFCAGNEKTYTFLCSILDEICELFPGEFIHLGGDEAPKDNWDKCSACLNMIKEKGLNNSHELQVYFSSRLAEYLKEKGKKVILWGDIVELPSQKLPDNVIIYWWNYRKKSDTAYQVAMQNGYKIICGTNYYTYLNFPVTPWSKYKADRTFDLKTAYENNPSDILNPNKLILGMGTCLWTDWNVKMSMIDKRVFPRILAMAEQMWNSKEKMPFNAFYEKVKLFFKRLEILGINFGPALKEEVPPDFIWD